MKKLLLLILVMAAGLSVSAQQTTPKLYSLPSPFERYTYYVATVRGGLVSPLGNLSKDYIDQNSLQNYSISIEWMMRNAFSIGGEVGYTYLDKQMPRTLYETSSGETISAVQTRTLTEYPIQFFGNYHFNLKNSIVKPYIQASAGVSVLNYTVYYGLLSDQDQKVKPTFGIGAGTKVLFKKDGSVGADLRVKYSATSYKYDYIEKGIQKLDASVGLFYRWW
jgi:outer membrane protein W